MADVCLMDIDKMEYNDDKNGTEMPKSKVTIPALHICAFQSQCQKQYNGKKNNGTNAKP